MTETNGYALPQSPAALLGVVQGRLAAVLESLLTRGAQSTTKIATSAVANYQGPDAELLRLQDEVIALALEALRSRPAAPPSATIKKEQP